MHPNPNKLLMVLFSFIPGAGHMYLGLMRRGVSFMAAFIVSIAATAFFESFLNLLAAAFGLFIPLIWFVAFFDFWRYPRMLPEERAAVQDTFLLVDQISFPKGPWLRRARVILGVLLILAGFDRLFRYFYWHFVTEFLHSERVIYFFDQLPTLLAAFGIIIAGLLLIFWKSRQLRQKGEQRYEG